MSHTPAMGTSIDAPSGGDSVHRLATSAGELAYFDQGDAAAPVVLLQHGFPDHPRTFFPLAERLRAVGYRTVSPFLRGYAPSTTTGPFDEERMGRDLVELAASLSPDRPVVVVGHDWGAVATYAAIRIRPSAFRSAVTLAVPHVSAFTQNLFRDRAQRRRSAYMFFLMLPLLPERVVPAKNYAFIDALFRKWSPNFTPPEGYLDDVKLCLKASMPAPLGQYRALAKAFGRKRSGALRSAGVHVPVLHLHGNDDGCIAPSASDGEDRYFNGDFRREILPGLGHFMHLEDADRVAVRILDFIGPGTA